MFYNLFKPIAFAMDAEKVHDLTISILSKNGHWGSFLGVSESNTNFNLKVGNRTWSFPIGLAAGLDKNAQCYDFFDNLGFGAVEVGTVTPLAQTGNPKPRLFRYPKEESLRNCMGFNNLGADFMFETVSRLPQYKEQRATPLGVNIGKNKVTPDEIAHEDYRILYEKFKGLADYIVVNVSSPNTPGLREHQSRDGLEMILKSLERREGDVDLFVKISPDMNIESLPDVIEVAKKYHVTGIIGTNTTIMEDRGVGGISGKLLFDKARVMRKKCLELTKEAGLEFIGVGGFSSFEEILEYWKDGGRAVQIYSAFIFQGPDLLKDIEHKTKELMDFHGVSTFEELLERLQEG